MILQETFKIGSGAGKNAPGAFIQDSIFGGISQVNWICWNPGGITTEGYSHVADEKRLYASGENQFVDGDVITVNVAKVC